ncbi:hypothetical protein OPT61_g8215 [Boeremia exigua]|uniref:Uncharacterized protein n=1 Tax=Boeremia exigua TaxID=749465 RepID=A0ACC2HZ68_9PLEO|nr:hypothetical protein OPT61_g8215 [Boeremia exigua]
MLDPPAPALNAARVIGTPRGVVMAGTRRVHSGPGHDSSYFFGSDRALVTVHCQQEGFSNSSVSSKSLATHVCAVQDVKDAEHQDTVPAAQAEPIRPNE